MGSVHTEQPAVPHVEGVLRDELARGDRALSGVAPVLSHLLASPGYSLVNDAILARLRGMITHIAEQILRAANAHNPIEPVDEYAIDHLANRLVGDSAILSHLYAVAVEAQITEQLEQRAAIDPVLSPLMQELIASDQPAVAELAMSTMTAQSAFVQSQRRMHLSLGELPSELFDLTVRAAVGHVREHGSSGAPSAVQALRRKYDEGESRLGRLTRLVSSLRTGARAALDLEHAGLALFASGLSILTRQPRELAVLSCHERQGARLALGLRAAGLEPAAIEQQFQILQPAEYLPGGLSDIPPERAQSLLGRSNMRRA